MKKISILLLLSFLFGFSHASYLLVPMDEGQKNHLKAYGMAFWVLNQEVEVDWLLNYRGGSFLFKFHPNAELELNLRGISFEKISGEQALEVLQLVSGESANMDVVKLEKAPDIAVYSPKSKQPWDDAVTMVLNYAEIPYDLVYDEEVVSGELKRYDWLHLHHEDFTGQHGKFWATHRHTYWYQQEVSRQERLAKILGFKKVSKMKLAVAETIKQYVMEGGFLFAMCSATDTYDIALAAAETDICGSMFDGDQANPHFQDQLNFNKTLAFKDFRVEKNPSRYEFADIDSYMGRKVPKELDYFSLFEFSAKWDPVPTMLCQNHTRTIKGFMGQTTAFRKRVLKPGVTVLGELKAYNEARYIHGNLGKGMWTYYGGHDPEDYRHRVGEEPTDLSLHPNSPGYRLILNNILFPAAKKKKRKT